MRDLTVRRLEALGYRIVVAENGPAALAVLEQRTDIDLVFSDVVMPGGLSGFDIATWVKQHRPNVRVLLTSGFAPEMAHGGAAVGLRYQAAPQTLQAGGLGARGARSAQGVTSAHVFLSDPHQPLGSATRHRLRRVNVRRLA